MFGVEEIGRMSDRVIDARERYGLSANEVEKVGGEREGGRRSSGRCQNEGLGGCGTHRTEPKRSRNDVGATRATLCLMKLKGKVVIVIRSCHLQTDTQGDEDV